MVGVDLNADAVYRDAYSYIFKIVATAALLVLAAALFILQYIKHLLGNPIKLISDASSQLADGSIDIPELPIQNDEIGILSTSIYRVADSVNALTLGLDSCDPNSANNGSNALSGKYLQVAQGIRKVLTIMDQLDLIIFVTNIETFELIFSIEPWAG